MDWKEVPTDVRSLGERWSTMARDLAPFAPHAANVFSRCAEELSRCLDLADDEVVTLVRAAEISGFSADHLGRQIREGKLANAGRKNAPRLRLSDLPLKAGLRPAPQSVQFDRRRIALAVTNLEKVEA